MPPNFNEQIGLQRSYTSRRESPLLEGAAARAIEDAFRELLEARYLYQKVTVDLDSVEEAVKPLVTPPPEELSRSVPNGTAAAWKQRLPGHLKSLRAEVEKRPWQPATRHEGDNPQFREIHRTARAGGVAIGTPTEKMPIHFYFPNVQIGCGICKRVCLFLAHVSSAGFSLESFYPKYADKGTEQVYQPLYRCEHCRTMLHTVLVQRVGVRLHLCGFAPRREPFATRDVPESLKPTLADAEQAVAEGDVFAGFYHLRTLLEHYLKQRLSVPFAEQLRGEELIARHHAALPVEWRSVLPSASEAYSGLSERLHARTGDAADFGMFRDKVCRHIEMLALLER